jgi:uncharacterized protein
MGRIVGHATLPGMKSRTPTQWNPARFDARAFAQAGAQLQETSTLGQWPRLLAEAHGLDDEAVQGLPLAWVLRGEQRPAPVGTQVQVWLHVAAQLAFPLRCQRCLGPVPAELQVDRWFRFVADEATAEIEDEDSDEDVLALEPKPNVLDLIEDELLMELPLVVVHESCPEPLQALAVNPSADEPPVPAKKNPFEVLQALKRSN